MNAVSPIQESEAAGQGLSIGELALQLHFKAYRACCSSITKVACCTFKTVAAPIGTCVSLTRKISLVDIVWTSSLKAVNGTFAAVFKAQLIPEESLKTLVQKRHELEIVELRKRLGENTIYPQFSKATAVFIDEFIPKFIAEKLTVVPRSAEAVLLYRLGYTVRYINYQLAKRFKYQDVLLSTSYGKTVQSNFDALRTLFSHFLLNKSNLSAVIDFEHLLLHVCTKLNGASKQPQSAKWVAIAVKSLAISLSQQKKIDEFLNQFQFKSEEEAFIARLEWHKKNNTLPKGLPDPHLERLAPQNLQQKLDEALCKHLDARMEQFLDQLLSRYFKGGLLRILYYLEGKDMLISLFTYLISEYGIKQVADPHLFALSILYSSGVEVMDYELDGFGRGKLGDILETGQKIMAAAAAKKGDWEALVRIFQESGLKNAPGSFEGILQKKDAKEHLRACIASMIYKMIKPEQFQHPGGILKMTREKACRLPLIGAATISLHLLINGTLFSLGYLFRNKGEGNTPYLSWMFKHLSGKNLANFLADKIIDLIYHPSWRITLLQMIDMLIEGWEEQQKNPHLAKGQASMLPAKEDLQKITEFLFQHFSQGSRVPFKENLNGMFDYFAGEGTFHLFIESLKSGDSPVLERGLRSVLPTIKELLLYTRVTDSFRKESVHFEGDAKFWECFIREYLNQRVAHRLGQQFANPGQATLAQISEAREKIVDELLGFEQTKLRSTFSKLPAATLESQYWVKVPKEVIDEEFFIVDYRGPLQHQQPLKVAGIRMEP